MCKNKLQTTGFTNIEISSKINLIYLIALPLMILLLGLSSNIKTAEAQEPFITIWQTNNDGESNDDQISIPVEGSGYDITIEWGDGSETEWQDGDPIDGLTHTYDSPGIYTVYIFGDFPRIYLNNEGDKDKILSVEHWGDIEWQTMERAFMGASNLEITATDAPDLSGVTSMARMFRDATSLNSDLHHWDVSSITSMSYLFFNASTFNGDISNWDTGNVVSMGWMFNGAASFNRDISSWNTSSVTSMREMFLSAGSFNQDLSDWDVSKVTDMTRMFRHANLFSADISGWNISNVIRMSGMFENADSFDHDLSGWDVSNVQVLNRMFNRAGLSPANYDNTLIGWAGQNLQNDVTFSASDMEYCGAVAARRYIIDTFNWSIDGDSMVSSCEGAFITRWELPAGSEEITISTEGGGYNYSVYWGDGTETAAVIGNASRNYVNEGTYSVAIQGDFPRIYFNNEGDKDKIVEVVQWGNLNWESMEWAFFGTSNLEIKATDTPDLSNVSSLQGMFSGSGVTGASGNWAWDTSMITNMRHLFYEASEFNGDISGWNTSHVTNMQQLFYIAEEFNQNIGGWDVSNVKNISGMFGRASSFNQNIGDWDVTNVDSFNQMFNRASSFNRNLNNWDVSNATNFGAMFMGATNFNGDISDWNVSGATNFYSMFRNAESFNQDISSWDVSNVTQMNAMFENASSFNQDLGAWNIENVTSMNFDSRGFLDNSGLSVVNYDKTLTQWAKLQLQPDVEMGAEGMVYCDASEARSQIINEFNWTITGDTKCFYGEPFVTIWQTDNDGDSDNNQITIPTADGDYYFSIYWESAEDETMNGTVTGATGDEIITFPEAGTYRVEINGVFPRIYFNNQGDKDKIVDVIQWGDIEWTSMEGAFWGASKLDVSAVDAPVLSGVTSMSRMFRDAESFNADIGHWNTENVESMRDLFSSASSFNQDIGSWDVSNVETTRNMFWRADQFNQDLNGWDTGKVTDMSRMFGDAESFNGDISNWNTSNVESMRRMFEGAGSFNQDIGNWNTDKVTRMAIMFDGSASFNQDISDWNTSGVTSMRRMFRDAVSFNQDLSSWDMGNVTDTESMFRRATSFNGNVSGWNTENVTSTYRMFEDAVSFNQSISEWDIHNVELLEDTFKNAVSFNQNLGNWDVSNVTWFGDLFDNTNLSVANYDSTLIGWASQTVHNDMIIGSEGLNFCKGADARRKLIDEYNWEFIGDSEMCELVLDSPELIAPAEDTTITNHEIELSWKPVNNAETYTVLIAGDSEFTDIIFEESGLESIDLFITDLEPNSTHYWRVRAEAGDTESQWSNYRSFSTGEFTNLDNDSDNLPAEFELAQNFPNPFNPTTQIRYLLPESAQVRLEVFNTLGQRVAVLVNDARPAGRHEAGFDASGLSSGLYIYRLQTESYTETRQMMLVK